MDNEMIERVTKAIYDNRFSPQSAAIASIKAMREPTPIMLRDADRTFEDRNYDRTQDLKIAYQAMIDSITND